MVTVMITPSGGMVRTGGEKDPFRSLNVKVLIKTFTLIPNMAIFVVLSLMAPLSDGVITADK